ncbi:MAG: type III pantothenate kinase [Alistipes sp.]|nr:type III pantothenate kinase [Alistipes sp.]
MGYNNLIIDTGNTFHKIAVIDVNNTLHEERVVTELTEDVIDELVLRYAPSKAIVSSTRGDARLSAELLAKRVEFVLCLDSTTPLPIGVDYNRATLGTDRIAAAVGAVEIYGADSPMMIIDAGTAITVDVVEGGVFRGGIISPGVDMRFEALNEKTATLPLCSPKVLSGELPQVGHNTEDAIIFGVMQSVFYEVKGYIEAFCEKNNKNLIIFIGGDAEYFVNQIKSAIFAGRKLIYSGLNRILEYNAENKEI